MRDYLNFFGILKKINSICGGKKKIDDYCIVQTNIEKEIKIFVVDSVSSLKFLLLNLIHY